MIDGLVQAILDIAVVIVGWFFMCFLSGAKERIEEKTKETGAGFVDNLSRYGSAVFRDKWQVSQFEKNVVPWILVFFILVFAALLGAGVGIASNWGLDYVVFSMGETAKFTFLDFIIVYGIFLIVVIFTLIKVHKAEVTPNTASTPTNENTDAADSSRLSNPAE